MTPTNAPARSTRRRLQVLLGTGRVSFTSDISATGMKVELARPLTPGSVVQGQIRVGDDVFPFAGQVAWAEAGDPRLGLMSSASIHFTNISRAFFERCFAPAVSPA